MKVPKDVDLLMWELAEREDPRAAEDFVQRYPQFRAELYKRISMVSGLKGAKDKPADSPIIPRFTPRQAPPKQAAMRWVPVAAFVLLAILAYASYLITSNYVSDASRPRYVAVPNNGLPDRNERITPRLPEPKPNQTNAGRADDTFASPSLEKPITIKIDRAPLLSVLDAVAAESGLILEVGPNMPNPEIRMEYIQVPGSQILSDLGREFGFTALKDGENRYLIVPAADPNARNQPDRHLGVAEILDPSDLPTDPGPGKSN